MLSLAFLGPIPQDAGYHLFADNQIFTGIPNFWNVATNLPFILVGLWGLLRVRRLADNIRPLGYLVLCIGILLVGFGSSYYHLAPSNASLVWDRLPMTIAFMALLAMVLEDRVFQIPSPIILWSLIAVGIVSVVYWAWTESLGRGDLRFYGLVQFLPMVLIPLILLMFRRSDLSDKLLFAAFVLYFIAKLFEHLDGEVFSAIGFSGHGLKHIVAAGAALCIIAAFPTRQHQHPLND